jgi:hypothetical protein
LLPVHINATASVTLLLIKKKSNTNLECLDTDLEQQWIIIMKENKANINHLRRLIIPTVQTQTE